MSIAAVEQPALAARGRRAAGGVLLPWLSWLALVWALAARITGPSDIWNQTQPKTMSYTTDMLITGGDHWLLPTEPSGLHATKPPMYNWLAAPLVALLGFSSEFAHKFPSVLALCGCWLLLVELGGRIDIARSQMLGWIAGMMLPANYTIFKLCYLARPDMLLTLWLSIAWAACTAALIGQARSGSKPSQALFAAAFWLCVTFAGLTKGPAAVVMLVYAVAAARIIGGSFKSVMALRPIGVLLPACVVGGWLMLVHRTDPDHLWEHLWFNEIYGRVTGTGPEGAHEGSSAWFTGVLNHFAYYLVRFLPWSLFSLAAMWVLWRKRKSGLNWMHGDDQSPLQRAKLRKWLVAATLFAWIIVGLFTLSAGKRADYIAAAFVPGSLLASAWLLRMSNIFADRFAWIAPVGALISLVALTMENRAEPVAPQRGFGNLISRFIADVQMEISRQPLPVIIIWSDDTPVHPMLGLTRNHLQYDALAAADARTKFWVIAGRKNRPPHEFSKWLSDRNDKATIQVVVQSALLPRHEHWPEQLTLYLVDAERNSKPRRPRPASPGPA